MPIEAREVNAVAVPEPLAKLNWISFWRDGDDFQKATDMLISALDTDLDWVCGHTRLLTRAIEWESKARNNSFVLRGDDLRAAERWLAEAGAEKERQPTVLQTEYIIASRKAATRRQKLTLGGVTFGFLIAVALAVVALFARQEALKQEAKAKDQTQVAEAATKKTSEVASRGNVSLARYAKEGWKDDQALAHLAQVLRLNPENREASGLTTALLTQLGWHVSLTRSMRHHAMVYSAQFSPDGQRVVTASADKTARLWDAANGKPVGEPMRHDAGVSSAQFSPDGERVVTVSADKMTRLWDGASGKPLGEPMKHEDTVYSTQFSFDGQRLVTASADMTARLWDGFSGKPLCEPMKHEGGVFSVQFSPDCQRVATASADKTARLWDSVIVTNKETKEDIFLLAELAEATGGVTWKTVEQVEILTVLTPEQSVATREKITAKYTRMFSRLTPLQRWLK
jgi:hypothetical protein